MYKNNSQNGENLYCYTTAVQMVPKMLRIEIVLKPYHQKYSWANKHDK